jgi:uncharacterized low-complexity protein
MKKFTLVSLLATSAFLVLFSSINVSADGMKCGSGKCGNSMKEPNTDKKESVQAMKCGSGNCGNTKKTPLNDANTTK